MVDKKEIQQQMADKWSIKPSLAGKLADIIEFLADKEEVRTLSQHQGFSLCGLAHQQRDYSYYYEQEE